MMKPLLLTPRLLVHFCDVIIALPLYRATVLMMFQRAAATLRLTAGRRLLSSSRDSSPLVVTVELVSDTL
jgi:hypothetical protein